VRMGDGDGGNAAETLHDLDRGGIDERDAVPQDVATRRAQQQRALPDGELRHRTDADQAGLVLPVAVEMSARERIERGPLLPAGRDELTLVLTDRTSGRRLMRRRELAAAGLAEEGGHSVRRSETLTPVPFVPRRAVRRNALRPIRSMRLPGFDHASSVLRVERPGSEVIVEAGAEHVVHDPAGGDRGATCQRGVQSLELDATVIELDA